ncbi:TRAP transporter small permease subunit [bacterium]|nr:TRAP transporter small permease subunit [bacterium]
MIDLSAQALGEPLGAVSIVMLGALAPFLLLPLAILAFGRPFIEIAQPAVDLVETVSDWAERIAQGLLVVLTLCVGVIVVLRYVFGLSFTALSEGALYAHAAAFLLAAPAALGRDGHVRVDVLYSRFSERKKAIVNLAAYVFLATPMLLTILHFAGPYVAASWRIAERSIETDGLPVLFIVKTTIPVFAVLLLAQAMAEACRAAATLKRLAPPRSRFVSEGGPRP